MAVVTLVRVPSLFAQSALTLSATPPIGLAYLAAYLRQAGHQVAVIDAIGEAVTQVRPFGRQNLFVNGLTADELLQRVPPDTQYLFVSLAFSHEWPLARSVIKGLKAAFPQVPVLCGGEHATAMPEFCLQDCPDIDVCVLGEGEETSRELLAALEQGRDLAEVAGIVFRCDKTVLRNAPRCRIRDVDALPQPAWDLLPLESYLSGGYSFGVDVGRTLPVLASRGCPYECTFCSNPQMWGRQWLVRSPEQVVAEMEDAVQRYRIQNFDFYDLTAILRKDWIVRFCRLLMAKDLNITWQLPSGTRAEPLDEEATALLYQSGCRNVSYAPESGSRRILKRIRKQTDPDQMLASMRAAVRNGLNLKANIILGFPGETRKDVLATYGFIVRMAWVGVHDTSVWTFSAYPGSQIYEQLRQEGRLPECNDEYFFSLLSYSDIKQAVSWNERFSHAQLKAMRIFGLVLFYCCNYLFRPVRLWRTVRNILRHQPESRLEMIVEKSLFRHRTARIANEGRMQL